MEKTKRWPYIFWGAGLIFLLLFIFTSVREPDDKAITQVWYIYRNIRIYFFLVSSIISFINGFVIKSIVNGTQEEIISLKQRVIDIEKSINSYVK